MSVKGWVLGSGVALASAWGAAELMKAGMPDGCFESVADNELYTVYDEKAEIAHRSWNMAANGKTCYQREGGGSYYVIPVIEYP